MKKRLRKTGEVVDVITYSNPYCSERDDMDCVSYIDSKGIEHHSERGLNLMMRILRMSLWMIQ